MVWETTLEAENPPSSGRNGPVAQATLNLRKGDQIRYNMHWNLA